MWFACVLQLNRVIEKFISSCPLIILSDILDSWLPPKKSQALPLGITSLGLEFVQTTAQWQKCRSCLASVTTNVTQFAAHLCTTHMDTQRQTTLISLSREIVTFKGKMHFRISNYNYPINGFSYCDTKLENPSLNDRNSNVRITLKTSRSRGIKRKKSTNVR